MKYYPRFAFIAVWMIALFTASAQIPGTTRVTAPIAPPATNSNIPAMDDNYLGGGARVSFDNVGDWMDTSILPTGRMKTNMIVRARLDPNKSWYRCTSISPRVFELDTDLVLKAQVDALDARIDSVEGSTVGVTVMGGMQELASSPTTPPAVFLRGWDAAYPGVGSGIWVRDTASTYPTNRAVRAVPFNTPTGRYLPKFNNGLIDITMFGARTGTLNDGAVQDAWSMQQSTLWPDKILSIPVGDYQITSTLANTTTTRFRVEGVGRGIGNSNNGGVGVSRLTMNTSDTPIFSITGADNSVVGLSLVYSAIHTTAQTNAACIWHNQVANLSRSVFRDLHMAKGSYGYCSTGLTTGIYDANNNWDNILVDSYSQSALYFGSSGTTMRLNHIYVQNLQNNVAVLNDTATISAISKAGTTITLTLSHIPTGMATNCFMYVSGVLRDGVAYSPANAYKVVTSVVGNVVKYNLNTDPGGTFTETAGSISFSPKLGAGIASVYFGSGCEWDASSLDVENCIHPGGTLVRNDGIGNIGNLHSEFTYSNNNAFYPVRNRGSLTIGTAVIINTGAPHGVLNGALLLNQDSPSSGLKGSLSVGNLNIRDISNVANGMTLAKKYDVSVRPVRLGEFRDMGTLRADATSALAYGDVTTVIEKDAGLNDKVILGTLGGTGPQLELSGGAGGAPFITFERDTLHKFGIRVLNENSPYGAFAFGDVTDDKFLFQFVPGASTLKARMGGAGAFQSESRQLTIQGDEPGTADVPAANLDIRPPWGSGSGSDVGGTITFRNPVAVASGTTAHTSLTTATIRAPLANRHTSLMLYNRDTGSQRAVIATNLTVDGAVRTVLLLE